MLLLNKPTRPQPLRANPLSEPYLPFALPDIGNDEIDEVVDCLRSGWITTGPKVKAFEEAFARRVNARYAVAVNSATAAMHLSLEAAGTQPGDLVFLPTYTFAATAEVVRYFDAIPVLVDSDPVTLNMAPQALACKLAEATEGRLRLGDSRVTLPHRPQLRAVIPVHIAGQPAEMDAIYELARHYELAVVEDAAHALPSAYRGRCIGATPTHWPLQTAGHATCFSFYATKTLTTGEGGMITTDDESFADRCRMMSLHGISKDAWLRYTNRGSWYYEIQAPGYKYNLTDIAAALGLAQLRKLHTMWQRRCHIARTYSEAFADLAEWVTVPDTVGDVQHAWHLYVLRLNAPASDKTPAAGALQIDRAAFVEELRQRQIGASVHFIPLHLHPYYQKTYGYHAADYPVAVEAYQRTISLPIYSRMSDGDVQRVIEAVRTIVMANRI